MDQLQILTSTNAGATYTSLITLNERSFRTFGNSATEFKSVHSVSRSVGN
ncbi:MAG: hypothetical protein R3A12_16050 [Ignavibacteria bacterium]